MVSVHGTGTPLGDPIEVGALGQSMAGSAAQPASLALGIGPLPAGYTIHSCAACLILPDLPMILKAAAHNAPMGMLDLPFSAQ